MFGFSSLVHAAAVLILLSIIIPIEMEDRVEILSALPTVDQENVKFEEVALVQPEQIEQDETSEVVQELITDSDKVLEIDINDLEISSAIPEKTKGAGNPVAKITGELGGRSRAGRSALAVPPPGPGPRPQRSAGSFSLRGQRIGRARGPRMAVTPSECGQRQLEF